MRGDLLEGLVAYWSLDETSGTRNDIVGGHNLTSVNSVGNTTGKFGNAATFVAASSQRLTTPDATNLRLQLFKDFTLSFWVKMSATGVYTSFVPMVAKYGKSFEPFSGYAALYRETGGRKEMWFFLYDNLGNTASAVITDLTFPAGAFTSSAWTHVCCTVNYFRNETQVYVNGVRGLFPFIYTPATFGGAYPLIIGADNFTSYFDGSIDDVAIWQRELGDQAIKDIAAGLSYPFRYGSPNFGKVRGIR